VLLLTSVVGLSVTVGVVRHAHNLTEKERQEAEKERKRAEAALAGEELARKERALTQIQALLHATPQAVPHLLKSLQDDRDDVLFRLHQLWQGQEPLDDPAHKARIGLALLALGENGSLVQALSRQALDSSDVRELLLVRNALLPYRAELRGPLWE